MSQTTGDYRTERGVGVAAWQPGQLVRMRVCPQFQGRYLRRATVMPGWGMVQRQDGVLDIGPLSSWEAVEA